MTSCALIIESALCGVTSTSSGSENQDMSDKPIPSDAIAVRSKTTSPGDAVPLIGTKIQVPRRRADLLVRNRLVNFIHGHLDCKLIVISAPAGFGKTSLLTDFAQDTELPVCWYALDSFDRDLTVFIEYLISAIARLFPKFGQRSRDFLKEVTDPSGNLYPMVATLVQDIYDNIPEYFVLVLDDHHTVEAQEQINEFLDLFVSYVDENCHVILASRTLPALPNLALLVARRQAVGMSVDELRFTALEVQALAQQNHGLALSLEQAAILARQTDGWITGLLLMAVPHWQRAQKAVPSREQISINLHDYFSEQVLDQQPPALRDFLLASSVLDELSPELCEAVLGIDLAGDLIAQLRSRNLFVMEFEEADSGLRYHDLFRDFLQSSLRSQSKTRFVELTRRAAKAYGRRGEWERAISRYFMLQDYESAAGIVEELANPLFGKGRWDTLANWIDQLPESTLGERPHLLVHRARILSERGDHSYALELYQRAEHAFEAKGDRAGAARVLATRSSLSRFQGRYAEGIAQCNRVLDMVSGATAPEKYAMALAHRNVGLCQIRLGQLTEGLEALQRALTLYEELDDAYNVGLVHHDLGLGHELACDLTRALDHYRDALQRWEQLGSLSPWSNTLNGIGVVYYLQARYKDARLHLKDALEKAQQAGDMRVAAFSWASLGDLHCDMGAYDTARQSYTKGLEVANRAGVGFIVTYTLDALGNALRLQGDRDQAREHLHKALQQAQEHKSTYEIEMCRVSLGILAAEEGELAGARQQLDHAIDFYRSAGYQQELARALLHRANFALLAGEHGVALAVLEEALATVTQVGFDQFLVVEGQRLQHLLHFAVDQGVRMDMLPDVLQRIEAHRALVDARPKPVIQEEHEPSLKIYALGQPQVELDGQIVKWPVATSRDIYFFLLQYPQGLRKEQIGDVFWPDHDPDRLDGVFRSYLYRLRRALFRQSVVYEDGLYRCNRSIDCWYDVEVWEKLLDGAGQSASPDERIDLLEKALTLYRGDYLEEVYADWSDLERQRLRERYLLALETLAGLYADRRKLKRAVELYTGLLNEDSYREVGHRELMRCYYRQGNRAAAIKQYWACVEILSEELGLSPAAQTEALYLKIIA